MTEQTRQAASGQPPPWWRNAAIYEVYLRSFADSDGDGEGDIGGLRARLPYLVDLGVDALWIAPWYPSPMADGGYDVSDYCDIHPVFGTMADADALVGEAHRLGLRVIVDLVANHTSDRHPWFVEALAASPGSAARNRYFFRAGSGADGSEPPNNWLSAFGSSAWTRVVDAQGRPEEWYLHLFAPQQPDLNWTDQAVRDGFDEILRFWLDRGIDGFRVDAVPAMAKVPTLPDARYRPGGGFAVTEWVDNPHWDVDSVHDILRHWRRLMDSYEGDHVFVAEAVLNGPERLALYLRPDELHTAFNFDYIHATWDADAYHSVIDATLSALSRIGASPTWALSNHDELRHVTRFGRRSTAWTPHSAGAAGPSDLALGTRRARAAALLTLALPGGVYLYQGEELGLPEVEDLPEAVLQDPVFARSHGTIRGRDGCRVPLPWSGTTAPFGFSPDGTSTWLPQPAEWAGLTAEAQAADPDSMLSLYREALRLRRTLPALRGSDFSWCDGLPEGVLAFDRGPGVRCVVNLGRTPVEVAGTILVASDGDIGQSLPPDTAAWLDIG